jgi:arylamine N-acetyltransferase
MESIVEFESVYGFVSLMDAFFDLIRFPQKTFKTRRFSKEEKTTGISPEVEVEKHMSDEAVENEHGKRATFIVQVQFRQYATWQGTITWAEEKKTSHFRSTLEMVKLMDNALAELSDADFAPEHNWE